MTNSQPFSLLNIKTETIIHEFNFREFTRSRLNKVLPNNPNRVSLTAGSSTSSSLYAHLNTQQPSFNAGPFRISNIYTLQTNIMDDGDLTTFALWLYPTVSNYDLIVYETVRVDK